MEHVEERDLPRIASEAEQLWLHDEAIRLYQRAVLSSETGLEGHMAWLLEQAGRVDEAIDCYQGVPEAGDPGAVVLAAGLLEGVPD